MKRSDSLRRKKEFRYTYRVGRSASTGHRYLVLVSARSRQAEPRIGFSVSKKLGTAVVRNRVKRRLREAVTPLIPGIKGHVNIIFIAREPIVEAPFLEIRRAMELTLRRAGLLKDAN